MSALPATRASRRALIAATRAPQRVLAVRRARRRALIDATRAPQRVLAVRRARRRALIAPALYLAATAALVALLGIPYQRDILGLWLLLGLLCFSLSDLRGYARGLVLDWLPFLGMLVAYDSLRATAGRLFGVHYLPQLQVDQWLFGGKTPTVALQRWLWHGHVVWYVAVLWGIYLTHFFATPLLTAVIWKMDRERFRVLAVRIATLSFAGLITYAVYPAAPPWMASTAHLIAPVTRIPPQVLAGLHMHSAGSLFEHGYRFANDVAAVPSLHAAFALLVAITVWPRKRRWLRPLVALYPVAMAFTLVFCAEHYVSDILLGWVYVVGSLLAARAIMRWWEDRKPASRPVLVPEPAYAEASSTP